MLLVIDVGNTNIVAGVYDGEELMEHWRFSTDRSKTSDEYGIVLSNMFTYSGVDMKQINSIIISSVVPPVVVSLIRMCERYFHLEPIIVGPGIKSGLVLRYENPREIGADRIVNAVAAYELYKDKNMPMIVIDFGTATTFCALLPTGEYLGGAIAPGIGISMEALFQRAAKLPKVELIKPEKVICRNTIKAMQSGIVYGYLGQMDGIIRRMREELGGKAYVIVTGGLGNMMSADSINVDVVEPFLTLEGLRLLYDRNKELCKKVETDK